LIAGTIFGVVKKQEKIHSQDIEKSPVFIKYGHAIFFVAFLRDFLY